MGAAVSLIYAAAFPEQVEKLVLLEGGWPLPRKVEDTASNIRKHIAARLDGNRELYGEERKEIRVYPSLDAAAETRAKAAKLAPGKQYLSKEAALQMVERGTTKLDDGGVYFHHDSRLKWPSIQYMLEIQNEALFHAVQSPTCILLAKDGWPFDEEIMNTGKELLQPQIFEMLPGSHHFHTDPDTADVVVEHIVTFLAGQQ
jgi:pimeloyl-ACP methyl ester carboxylesterase